MLWGFGDLDAYELRRFGEVVALEPQLFDVLAYLLANRDRVVTKEELLDPSHAYQNSLHLSAFLDLEASQTHTSLTLEDALGHVGDYLSG